MMDLETKSWLMTLTEEQLISVMMFLEMRFFLFYFILFLFLLPIFIHYHHHHQQQHHQYTTNNTNNTTTKPPTTPPTTTPSPKQLSRKNILGHNQTFTYDLIGRMTSRSNSTQTAIFEYNDFGKMANVTVGVCNIFITFFFFFFFFFFFLFF